MEGEIELVNFYWITVPQDVIHGALYAQDKSKYAILQEIEIGLNGGVSSRFYLVKEATEQEIREELCSLQIVNGPVLVFYIGGTYQDCAPTLKKARQWLEELESNPEDFE